jgi:ethanolamine utilization protein EutQ (cupin superfamily)
LKHVRGEKVVFDKGDYRHLDAMPSARHENAKVLGLPRGPGWMRRCIKSALILVMLVVIAIGSLFIALEEGYLDSTLTARAEASLSSALGADFKPEVGKVRLRFSDNWLLAVAAVDVKITHVKTGIVALKTDSIAAVLDPMPLLSGRMELARLEIGRAEGDLRFLPPRPVDWASMRIDRIPGLLAGLYPGLDQGVEALRNARTEEIIARNVSLTLPQPTKLGDRVDLGDFDFSHVTGGRYQLTTSIRYGKLTPVLSVSLDTEGGKVQAMNADLSGLDSEPLLLKYDSVSGLPRQGINAPLTIALSASRDRELALRLSAGEGLFYSDGDDQPLKSVNLLLAYDFKDSKIELTDGLIDMGEAVMPLEGSAVDLDKVAPGKPPGFSLSLNVNDGVSAVPAAHEKPEHFNFSAQAYVLPLTAELFADSVSLSTDSGTLTGTAYAQFVPPTPALRIKAHSDTLSVASIKQLWPYWIAKKQRTWVLDNLTNGTVRNAEMDINLAAGRIPDHPGPLIFRKGELHIGFDAEDTSIRFSNTMPASRKTDGHFVIDDRDVRIDIKDGEIALPSGKVVKGGGGIFEIADTAQKPLMATLSNLIVSGEASALAELSAYKPINAMSRVPFAAKDISGNAEANLNVTFGLEKEQKPPPPVFDVTVDLDKVSLLKTIENRKVTNVDATLTVDPQSAVLKGKAEINGIGVNVSMTEPVVKGSDIARQWLIEGNVTRDEIVKMAPSLASYVSGDVGVRMEKSGDEGQKAKIDLTSTSLSIPFIGWRKGPGIPATAEFTLVERDGQTDIRDLEFDGDGFGAKGSVTLDKRGLVSAKFSRVKFANSDSFALNLARKSGGLSIEVSGESIDLRPFLDKIKSPDAATSASTDSDSKAANTIIATIGRATGYNKESLSSVILKLSTAKGKVQTLNFSGVTRSGQAVVIKRDETAGSIDITAGDAGAVARFTDLYHNMDGGLLNVSLRRQSVSSWEGTLDIRNFELVNEQRLKSIVSARNGADGRSLSDAVNTDINTSSQKFRRGFARVMLDGKVVKVDNGIVRGDQVGATFQGTVRDARGRTEMTGTFMPAYGLNSLFGQLPLIGNILGNGRDRGLLGITFKLEGPFDHPKLTVNPLSLIAPGVFRNIFEFQ